MASPVNIRVAAAFPFPALVRGAAPVTVSKANGIWTVALDVADLTAHVPSVADLGQEYWIVWDSIRLTYFKVALSTLGVGGARLQRAANASPIVVAANDQVINFSIGAPATCALPSYATRNGVPLTFNDSGGLLTAVNKLRITPLGAETIDGLAFVDMVTKHNKITLTPYNDGTNTGWYLE